LEVEIRLLQRALGVHHRRARLVAELLDDLGRDLDAAHDCSSVSATGSSAGASASGSAAALGALPFSSAFWKSRVDTFCWPSAIASAITLVISAHDRIASSLPGTM